MICEICGKEIVGEAYRISIEATELTVCRNDSVYGRIVRRINVFVEKEKKNTTQVQKGREQKSESKILGIIPDFHRIVKQEREKLGLSQEEFARKISEKESLLNKIESGKVKPSMAIAHKLEKALKVKIIKEVDEESVLPITKSEEFTIGDVIRIKNRKK
ncbi:MAG TPA: multiprotein bridging factor aMBF1 [Candidatus Nanoarchaeia archaeon]|nr:multiprotein bridging factor aMBF1 [Candidatus Nanoarchaeia archaeon]